MKSDDKPSDVLLQVYRSPRSPSSSFHRPPASQHSSPLSSPVVPLLWDKVTPEQVSPDRMTWLHPFRRSGYILSVQVGCWRSRSVWPDGGPGVNWAEANTRVKTTKLNWFLMILVLREEETRVKIQTNLFIFCKTNQIFLHRWPKFYFLDFDESFENSESKFKIF